MDDYTTIKVKVTTREALKEIGNMGDTYDALLQRLINKK